MRFHVEDLTEHQVRLEEDESQHARKVLRVQAGDEVDLFDGRGGVARGKVLEARRQVVIEVSQRSFVPRLTPRIDLAVAIPKGDRASMLVEKASELGADRLIPLISGRSVVDPREGKIERLRRIAMESAKQCGRAWLMEVREPRPFEALVRESDHDRKLIADFVEPIDRVAGAEALGSPSLRGGVEAGASRTGPQPPSIIVLVGPEGGWTDDERRMASAAGFRPWRLNANVLRIETAALAALAILRRDA